MRYSNFSVKNHVWKLWNINYFFPYESFPLSIIRLFVVYFNRSFFCINFIEETNYHEKDLRNVKSDIIYFPRFMLSSNSQFIRQTSPAWDLFNCSFFSCIFEYRMTPFMDLDLLPRQYGSRTISSTFYWKFSVQREFHWNQQLSAE